MKVDNNHGKRAALDNLHDGLKLYRKHEQIGVENSRQLPQGEKKILNSVKVENQKIDPSAGQEPTPEQKLQLLIEVMKKEDKKTSFDQISSKNLIRIQRLEELMEAKKNKKLHLGMNKNVQQLEEILRRDEIRDQLEERDLQGRIPEKIIAKHFNVDYTLVNGDPGINDAYHDLVYFYHFVFSYKNSNLSHNLRVAAEEIENTLKQILEEKRGSKNEEECFQSLIKKLNDFIEIAHLEGYEKEDFAEHLPNLWERLTTPSYMCKKEFGFDPTPEKICSFFFWTKIGGENVKTLAKAIQLIGNTTPKILKDKNVSKEIKKKFKEFKNILNIINKESHQFAMFADKFWLILVDLLQVIFTFGMIFAKEGFAERMHRHQELVKNSYVHYREFSPDEIKGFLNKMEELIQTNIDGVPLFKKENKEEILKKIEEAKSGIINPNLQNLLKKVYS